MPEHLSLRVRITRSARDAMCFYKLLNGSGESTSVRCDAMRCDRLSRKLALICPPRAGAGAVRPMEEERVASRRVSTVVELSDQLPHFDHNNLKKSF